MIMCLPKSMCSRNYRVRGLPEGEAEVLFDSMTEQGEIILGGQTLRVCKHGIASGRWTLEADGEALAEAVKPSAMSRLMEIRTLGSTLTLQPRSMLSNVFEVHHDGHHCGTVRTMHSFTRRAVIECDDSLDSLTQLFAFWMVALMWRRNENAAAAS
jgi:hypothetical protein